MKSQQNFKMTRKLNIKMKIQLSLKLKMNLKIIVSHVILTIILNIFILNLFSIKKWSEKNFFKEEWKLKVKELGLKYNMGFNQVSKTSHDYNDSLFANGLQTLHNIHPHIRFNT